ncbi:MAG: BACON domain-containing carbohydrate-binding protein [Alistipes sp.]|nr:BACON domain-containing carbohydrate-binding protein [Alistipes sp.]
MKRIYILPLLATLLATACQQDNTSTTTIQGFESDSSKIEAIACGGEYKINIRSEKEWTAKTDVAWIMVSPANGRGEVCCVVKVDSTLLNDERSANISFASEGVTMQDIDVVQQGFGIIARAANSDDIEIEASAPRAERHFDIEIEANVEFDIDTESEWLSVDKYTLTLDRGARPRRTTLGLDWKMNSEPAPRKATLHLRSKDGEPLDTIVVRQAAGPLIEDNRTGDSLAVVTIYEKMGCWADGIIDLSESMDKWECLRLWKSDDSTLPSNEAIGRVRDLDLSFFNTEDDIPVEFKHLKYLETLSLMGNINTMLKDIKLCPEVATLNYLKDLRIVAMGLVSLPSNFADLGDTLETLDLSSNNFTVIPDVINAENFRNLVSLDLSSNRRSIVSNLAAANRDAIGLYCNMNSNEAVKRLLLWERLEELSLSYNYIEGSIPDFTVGKDGVRGYTAEDVAERGDTLNYAVTNNLPRILPNMRALRINLNFITGKLPDWLLYHPNLLEWSPEILIYTQMEKSYDSKGNYVEFDNVPTSREYYFEAYPLYRSRYEFNDIIEEE